LKRASELYFFDFHVFFQMDEGGDEEARCPRYRDRVSVASAR